jgi:hypothetical protein
MPPPNEDLETLHPGALVGELTDEVEDRVNHFLIDSVVAWASLFAGLPCC